MVRQQIKLTFYVGTAAAHPFFEATIAEAASAVCGGCTTRRDTGWWREGGAARASTFDGKLQTENAFVLELTCEPEKAAAAYEATCAGIVRAAQAFNIETDWVHVTREAVGGMHFSVQDAIAARAAELRTPEAAPLAA